VKNTIGIIGLGWLGLPLALELSNKEHYIKGTVRSLEKSKKINSSSISCVSLDIDYLSDKEFYINYFKDCTAIIITIPPSKVTILPFHNAILSLLEIIPEFCTIIYISSTSIYSDQVSLAQENSKSITDYNSSSPLFVTESEIQQKYSDRFVILRLGGLIGENRNPTFKLSEKVNLSNSNSPVNVVHNEDVNEIVYRIIKQNIKSEIFNVCCDNHLSRKEFYEKQSEKLKIKAPQFIIDESSSQNEITKIVDNSKIKKSLNFQFKHNFIY
jgi:nucleoside-diphosphate-sugar epimerase